MHNSSLPVHALPLALACLTAALSAGPALATVSVPNLFGDHMVLQRDQPVLIWGTADPGEAVAVSLAGANATATAGTDGKWRVSLPALAAGGPHTLTISGANELVFSDVLVGEVWLASGQSNMQWTVTNSVNADLAAVTSSRNRAIRLLPVKNSGSQEPQSEVRGEWSVAGPDTVGRYSAVAYAFAESLHAALGVPVGIIENSWGGSSAEAWVDRAVIAADPQLSDIHEKWLETEATYDFAAELAAYNEKLAQWETEAAAARAAGAKPPQQPRKPTDSMTGQHRPGNLWNARVLPVAPVALRGVIWYQGESNANPVERALQYEHLFATLISQWRDLWGAQFPFYWVQLADFRAESAFGEDETWPVLRESQTRTLQSVPATGQAVITDLGEGKDIHPRFKEEVGRRLARWALNRDYGFTGLACRSPEFAAFTQQDARLAVTFNHTGGGLRALDTAEVRGFVVLDQDGAWRPVSGKVTAPDTVELTLPDGVQVAALRYAWADNPVCNLFSLEGLPVTPFRTDRPD